MSQQTEINLEVIEAPIFSSFVSSIHSDIEITFENDECFPTSSFIKLQLRDDLKAELCWNDEIHETATLTSSDWLKIRESGFFVPITTCSDTLIIPPMIPVFPTKYEENFLALVVISKNTPKIYGANLVIKATLLNDHRIYIQWDFTDQCIPEKIAVETTHLYDGKLGCLPRLTVPQQQSDLEASGMSKAIITNPGPTGIILSVPNYKSLPLGNDDKVTHVVLYSLDRKPRGTILFHRHASV